jgi:integrase
MYWKPQGVVRRCKGYFFGWKGGAEMPKKGENIRRRKDGYWEGRYPNGVDEQGRKKCGSVYGKTYAEAKQKLLAAKSGQMAQRRSQQRSFDEVLREWLDTQALRNKPATQVKFGNLISGHIAPALGGVPLAQISTARLTKFLQEQSANGRLDGQGGLSASTLQALALILKSVLDYAAQERYIPPMALSLKYPEVKREPAKAFSVKQQEQLEEYLRRDLDAGCLGIQLCLYTGLRIGEICALRWGDVDFSTQLIHVRRTVQRLQAAGNSKTMLHIGPPKSESSLRSIPIPPCLLELLQVHRSGPGAYLLTGQDSLLEPRSYQYRFKKYIAEAGVPDVNFHILRHTFATRFIESGGDAKTLSELLGHASVEITLNKYVHPSMDSKREQMERFSAMRGGKSGSAPVGG